MMLPPDLMMQLNNIATSFQEIRDAAKQQNCISVAIFLVTHTDEEIEQFWATLATIERDGGVESYAENVLLSGH